MKKSILGFVLLVALLPLFLAASSARAQLRTIEDPHGGTIVYGVVRGATKTATAMASILRTIGENCGERPQIGQVFRARGTNSESVFFTVINHPRGNKLVAGLLIAVPSGGQVEAALVSDEANRFGSTINPMLNRLFSEWHPGGGGGAGGGRPAPLPPMHPVWNQDRSASVAIPAGWTVLGNGGTTHVNEPSSHAILSLNMVRLAANPSYDQPRSMGSGMAARLIFPSNVDLVRALPSLLQEFYRLLNQRLVYRITQVEPVPGPQGQRCAHASGHGAPLGMNQPLPNLQEKDYPELEAIVCETAPAGLTGNYFVSVSTTEIDPRFADQYRATVAAILQSYQVNQAVVTGEAWAMAKPAIDAIHQIGRQAADRYAAVDRANDAQHAGYREHQDTNARTNQGFHNYILDQTVVQNNNVYGTGAVGHSTEWNSVANALVRADPNKYEIVNYPNFWEGTDYHR